MNTKDFGQHLGEGLKYPWNKGSRLWNILWILIPILGWFAIVGYFKRIVKGLVNGQTTQLPAFGSFWENFKEGLMVSIFLIPTFVVLFLIGFIPFVGGVVGILIEVFLLPWLIINLLVKGTFGSVWEIKSAYNEVFDNIKEYVIAYIKTLIYLLIYGLLSIIIIGIPALTFGNYFFLAEFYRNNN